MLSNAVGYAKWTNKNLNMSRAESQSLKYNDLFNVDKYEVYEFVKKHGWNYYFNQFPEISKLVSVVNELPDPNAKFAEWLFLPLTDQGYPLATFNSFDRNLWNIWYFQTKQDRDIFIIQKLIDYQKSFFK